MRLHNDMNLTFDKQYVLDFAKRLLTIDSPSSYTKKAAEMLQQEAEALGYSTYFNQKGNLYVNVSGENSEETIALTAHFDTLGLMVRSIKSDGKLAVTKIGGPLMPTLDGEYCRIYTRTGSCYKGTILSTSCAAHVYKDSADLVRDDEHMEVRIDEVVSCVEDVKKLGIENGDIIAIDPKVEILENGFIKSRFLDDKISVSAIMGVLHALSTAKQKPKCNILIMLTSFEEVGHGGCWVPEEVSEVLAVDMGCIGLDLSCSEQDVSICAKDSGGPYDYEMTSKLIALAKELKLSYAVDIYPFYRSDVTAALHAGNNIRGALIGPGVHASHGMERTHYRAVEQTMKLVAAYICTK